MTALTPAPEPAQISGKPSWIERSLNVKAGRDPLGLQTITLDRIMPILLPGILVLSRRARYFSFYPFLLEEYEQHRLPPSNDALSRFIKQREFEYALAVQLCPRGCGAVSSGAVGKDRAGPAARSSADSIERQESVESFLGGYGLYYRTPLSELGVVIPKGAPVADGVTPVDILHPSGPGHELAQAFQGAIAETAYYTDHMWSADDAVPTDALRELSERACLCRLNEFPEEQRLLREALYEAPAPPLEAAFNQRRRSFAVFLREVGRSAEVVKSNAAFRKALWDDFEGAADKDGPLPTTLAQWAALAMKEYVQESLSSIWAHFCRLGVSTQSGDGMDANELDAMVKGPLLEPGSLELDGHRLQCEAGMPTVLFAERASAAASQLSCEELRSWVLETDTAAAGLVLLLVTISRLPSPEAAPRAWLEIALQHSERQPGLIGVQRLFNQHLADSPQLSETLAWIVRRFVIGAHERIAYSKLPDFTFRFRWEGGRLRFYSLGLGRFDLADMRRESMARISADLGLWGEDSGDAALTPIGQRLVDEVLG